MPCDNGWETNIFPTILLIRYRISSRMPSIITCVNFVLGIEYLYENGLLQRTPEDVAQFLHKGEGLSKTAIGDYLGERSEFNEAVLKAFVELHDFTDLILVQALR